MTVWSIKTDRWIGARNQPNTPFKSPASDVICCHGIPASGGGQNRPSGEGFWIHPPDETDLARRDDGIALILIAESLKQVIKLAIHLGNLGLCLLTAPKRAPIPYAADVWF